MIPYKCSVAHKPPQSYGDCLRVAIASILDVTEPETVPHFLAAGVVDGWEQSLDNYLMDAHGLVKFVTVYDGELSLSDVLEIMQNVNRNVAYLLTGNHDGNNHTLVCGSGRVLCDPGWFDEWLDGPASDGYWHVTVFVPAKLVVY